jgi:TetR/AcrR family transcriptional regulator, mexJK operon transcriptional repressor
LTDLLQTVSTRRGPGRPTASQARERERELLEVAFDLFCERGFDGTTIEAITTACNMAKRTVYARFEDKTALFRVALHHAIEQWSIPIEQLHAEEDEDFEASLLRISRILVRNMTSPAGQRLWRITNAEAHRIPDVGMEALKDGTDAVLTFLTDLFRRRVRPENPANPYASDAAQAFMYLIVSGPAGVRLLDVPLDDAEIDRQTVFGVRLFLHGLIAA